MDCFAGEGSFKDGEDGSPLIAIKNLFSLQRAFHVKYDNKCRFFIHTVELNEDYHQKLVQMGKNSSYPTQINNYHGEFKNHVQKLAKSTSGSPALYFIDPFGYKGVHMFIRDPNVKLDYSKFTTQKDNRSLRKCLLPIANGIYACPVQIFEFAVMGTYLDFLQGRISVEPLQKELGKFYKEIDIAFEKEVYNLVVNNISSVAVHQMQKIPEFGKKGFVIFPRELDVLVIYEKTLFVLECKNFDLKISAQSMANEMQRLTKKGKDSISYKMSSNINMISENWDSVIQYLGVDPITIEKHQPVGVIVTKGFSIGNVLKDTPYPIIPFDNLLKWFQLKEWNRR